MHLLTSVLDLAGLRLEVLEEADNAALQYGREFGNRGQCNPTYFTVGNLLKRLISMRDNQNIPTDKIISDYAFVTAGGCGPCRMGMYATEYRKALRDSGFEGFRVLLLTRSGDIQDVLTEGLRFSNQDLFRGFLAMMIGDILNSANLKNRPFERRKGHVDEEIQRARTLIQKSMKEGKLIRGLWRSRRILKSLEVDTKSRRPVVHIMGEFWAKTTDGDGNYHLFRFIEGEGGVVSNETITDWLLHQVWRARWISKQKSKRIGVSATAMKLLIVEKFVILLFKSVGLIMGHKVRLSDHQALAREVQDYFDLHVDGGEDHMEVAHHIHIAKHKTADLIVSVKPFTCLSSSGVSDGVQTKISELYPQVEFIAVETNGDSAANFYSRIQMALQKVLNRNLTGEKLH